MEYEGALQELTEDFNKIIRKVNDYTELMSDDREAMESLLRRLTSLGVILGGARGQIIYHLKNDNERHM